MKKLFYTLLYFSISSSTIAQQYYLDLYDIYAVSPDMVWTIGQDKGIYKTIDGGTTWYKQFTSTETLNSISFFDSQSGIAVGANGVIFTTSNGGVVWNSQSSGVNTALNDICCINPDTAFIVGDSGIILRTTNGGVNWTQQQSQTTSSLVDIKFRNNMTGIIAGGTNYQEGKILKTNDGGITWSQVFTDVRKMISISCLSAGKWIAADIQTEIFKSSDDGSSWESCFPFSYTYMPSDMYFFNDFNGICVGAKRLIHPSGTAGFFWRTNNGGLSWSFESFTGAIIPAVSFSGQIGYCTTINDPTLPPGNTLFKSFNSGANWTSIYLPVELESFNAVVSERGITLLWTTASEINNRGFEIERREDDSDFRPIGFVNGKGTTTEIHNYTFFDIPPENGKYFYRLKQQDLNGNSAYSEVLTVMYEVPGTFRLSQNYPNPFNPSTTISYSIPEYTNISIKVFDILGNEIETLISEEKPAGSYEAHFDGTELTSGVYFYRVHAGDFISTKRMVLMK